MKKFLSLVALVGIMAACNNKKEDKTETKTDSTATTPTTTQPTTTEPTTTTTTTTETPKFSDPEIQKFVDDYAAFITEYKAGINDPAKAQALSKTMTDWSTKSQSIGMKLANNPEDLKKWSDWWQKMANELMPVNK